MSAVFTFGMHLLCDRVKGCALRKILCDEVYFCFINKQKKGVYEERLDIVS
jgi:hypothetical protein